MTTTAPTSRRGKLRAILAGGLVLGVGAAITLAAWNDSEFGTATFTAGSFSLEGSTDNAAFSEHPTAGSAATLAFTVNPANLSPTDVVYAPFAVRLTAATTNDAVVTVIGAPSDGTVSGLTYELIQTDAWGCGVSTTGTTLVPAGTALGTVPGTPTFQAEVGDPAGPIAGEQVNLCFRVTAGAITQGQTGTATWQFSATSQP